MTEKRLAGEVGRSGVSMSEVKAIARRTKKEKHNKEKHALSGGEKGAGRAEGGKQAKWKNESSALRDAMQAARIMRQAEKEGKDLRTVELPPASNAGGDDGRTPCPHCGRRFNTQAAERHIPKCKSMKAKPTRLKAGGGVVAAAGAAAGRGGGATRGAGGATTAARSKGRSNHGTHGTAHSTTGESDEQKLLRFYKKHDPSKATAAGVQRVLGRYSLEELAKGLRKKYGSAPAFGKTRT
jgi:hypothetical protein